MSSVEEALDEILQLVKVRLQNHKGASQSLSLDYEAAVSGAE